MTIRNESELTELLPDNQQRAIQPATLRDLVQSLIGVGGTLYANDVDLPVETVWQPLTVWTNSIDTKGITEDLVTGEYVIGAGADGVYAVDVSMGVFSNFAGWIEISLTKNGSLTPFRKKRSLTAGGDGVFDIIGSGNLVAGDRVGVAIRGSGNATATLTNGQFRAKR